MVMRIPSAAVHEFKDSDLLFGQKNLVNFLAVKHYKFAIVIYLLREFGNFQLSTKITQDFFHQ